MKVEIKEAPGGLKGASDGRTRGARETLEFDGAKENALQTRRSNRGFCPGHLVFVVSQYARSSPPATGTDSNLYIYHPFIRKFAYNS